MSHKTQPVAEATQEQGTTKEAMVYDVVNLTEEQADNIINTCSKLSKVFQKERNQCNFLKGAIDSVETLEEKIYAAFVVGKMSEENENPFFGMFSGN